MSGCEIARKINRSKTVIYNFLKSPKEYDKKKCTIGPPTYYASETLQLSVVLA